VCYSGSRKNNECVKKRQWFRKWKAYLRAGLGCWEEGKWEGEGERLDDPIRKI